MACLTERHYYITGCTDADVYTVRATSVDFQMSGAATGDLVVNYKACLQKYDSVNGWINWECKSGSFLHDTGIISFDLNSPRPPQGSYRIKVENSMAFNTNWTVYTTTFIIQ